MLAPIELADTAEEGASEVTRDEVGSRGGLQGTQRCVRAVVGDSAEDALNGASPRKNGAEGGVTGA